MVMALGESEYNRIMNLRDSNPRPSTYAVADLFKIPQSSVWRYWFSGRKPRKRRIVVTVDSLGLQKVTGRKWCRKCGDPIKKLMAFTGYCPECELLRLEKAGQLIIEGCNGTA